MTGVRTPVLLRFRGRMLATAALTAVIWLAATPGSASAQKVMRPNEGQSDEAVKAILPPAFLLFVATYVLDGGLDGAIVHNPELAALAQNSPEIITQARIDTHAELAREVTAQEPGFYLAADRDFEAHLTGAQILTLVEFYHTATGRKVVAVGPRLTHRGEVSAEQYDLEHPVEVPDATPQDISNLAAFNKTDAANALKAELPNLKKLMLQWLGGILGGDGTHEALQASISRQIRAKRGDQ